MILVPVLVVLLVRLNHQYESRRSELEHEARSRPPTAPVLRRHTVLVLVDDLDRSAARAMQYARTLHARRAAGRAHRRRPANAPRR